MNPRETPLIGLVAAVFTMVSCQIFARATGHHAQFSSAQVSAGLTICLAGVVVGLLLVLCMSAFQEARSGWERSLGAFGLALGCALLFALVGRHLPHAPLPHVPRADAAVAAAHEPANAHWVMAVHDVAAHEAPLLAPNPSR